MNYKMGDLVYWGGVDGRGMGIIFETMKKKDGSARYKIYWFKENRWFHYGDWSFHKHFKRIRNDEVQDG